MPVCLKGATVNGLSLGLDLGWARARAVSPPAPPPWTPASLAGTPREWLADPLWCYTDGSAAFASASSQSLSVASNSTLQTGDVDFWVAGWVDRVAVGSNESLFSKGYSGASGGEFTAYLQSGDNAINFSVRDAADTTTYSVNHTSAFSAGAWAFVIAWHDAANDTINVSVNGGTPQSAAATGGVFTGTGAFELGAITASNFLNGRMASWAFGKSPPGGIAGVISTIRDRLYASGNGIVYADTTAAERTDWGLVSWWDLVRSGVFTDSHGTNHLTNNNGVTFGAGLPRSRCGDTDPVSAWVDRIQGTTVTQADPLKRPTLRLSSGRWVVRGDGVNDWMQALAASLTLSQPYTAWAALTKTSGLDTSGVILDSDSNVQAAWYFGDGLGAVLKLASGGTTLATTVAGTSPTVALAVAHGASSRVRANQAEWTGSPGTNSLTGLRVFDIRDAVAGGYTLAGDIASFGLLNSAISVVDQAQLEAYLNSIYPSY